MECFDWLACLIHSILGEASARDFDLPFLCHPLLCQCWDVPGNLELKGENTDILNQSFKPNLNAKKRFFYKVTRKCLLKTSSLLNSHKVHKLTYVGAFTPTKTIKPKTKHSISLQSTAWHTKSSDLHEYTETAHHSYTHTEKKKQPNTSCRRFRAINSSFKNMISDTLIANQTCHQFTHHNCDRHCSQCHSLLSFFSPLSFCLKHPIPLAPTLSSCPSSSVTPLWGQWEDRQREVGNRMTKDAEREGTDTE